MNFKHYFPTFRTRWRFLNSSLSEVGHRERALHIGCGEGDHDQLIKRFATRLVACDLNADDVEYARSANAAIAGIEYRVEDATALSLPAASFDTVVCMEVIEHVSDPRALLAEIVRVLAPGGRVILTCPSEKFPLTYDPINYALERFHTHLPFGAYGYGHNWLVNPSTLADWFSEARLNVLREERLTGWLASAPECYWLGLVQKVAKANSANNAHAKKRGLRPSSAREPFGVAVVDAFVSLDAAVPRGSRSVGLGYVLERGSA
ncbi:MAG: class I SAM-dependent methyltransferase [Myxococcota bacterium]